MANSDSGPRVKTAQFVDPRIEPQPAPVYDYVIAPTQNQFYKIPASGKSDSFLTFNNLTTLGIDRAYLDTFEIELEVTITFDTPNPPNASNLVQPDTWTFQSFPFNSCCDEARVNINGGAFFSQPMCYVRAKERYMDQYRLSQCYENICPIHKPLLQYESGRDFGGNSFMNNGDTVDNTLDPFYTPEHNMMHFAPFITAPCTQHVGAADVSRKNSTIPSICPPTRYGIGLYNTIQSEQGLEGGYNNAILKLGNPIPAGGDFVGYDNYYRSADGTHTYVKVTFREPLFVSPFSSRYDANYGRPLYNITSMDFAFNLQNLKNMIRLSQIYTVCGTNTGVGDHSREGTVTKGGFVTDYHVHIDNANLCYQVMTIPTQTIQKPITTLVPYRRFVPYITEYNSQSGNTNGAGANTIAVTGAKDVTIRSGIYTLNEIPTAIWVFCGPTKDILQSCPRDSKWSDTTLPADGAGNVPFMGTMAYNWECNNLFAGLKHIDITLANTTQILNTADQLDLYRIAKANGCQDSFWSWSCNTDLCYPRGNPSRLGPMYAANDADSNLAHNMSTAQQSTASRYPYQGAGSVLRLKPGVDIIIPDIPLIPGANANNMVLQVTGKFDIPPHSYNRGKWALWLLFEYVGVAAISPGQCEITMNPLGSGEVMNSSPVYSATSTESEGELEGSGFWDKIKKAAGVANQLAKESGIVSKILKLVPNENVKKVGEWVASKGYGEPGCKRMRGGRMIGDSMDDWI